MEIVDAIWLDFIAGGRGNGNNGGDRTDKDGTSSGGSCSW